LFASVAARTRVKDVHLRSDNGNPMKGMTILAMLYHLGITPSFSRPRVSNDNPFIESYFKTLKYAVGYPVVPISMIKGQTEGISLLTQYNGHGIFIALEELGFILMSLVFLFLSPIFNGNNRLEKAMKRIFAIPSILILLSYVYYAIQYGLDRDYRFEVAAITIDWLATITIGILSSIYFLREMRKYKNK
jgi:transposase InsO family protein